jgi:hypothetical protein
VTTLPSPASDGTVEAMLVVAQYRCRGDLAMARCRCRVMLAMSLPSHTARLESGSTTRVMMCDQSQDIPAL